MSSTPVSETSWNSKLGGGGNTTDFGIELELETGGRGKIYWVGSTRGGKNTGGAGGNTIYRESRGTPTDGLKSSMHTPVKKKKRTQANNTDATVSKKLKGNSFGPDVVSPVSYKLISAKVLTNRGPEGAGSAGGKV